MGGLTATTKRRLATLRQRLERRRSVRDLLVAVPGACGAYRIAAPADPDAVLDEIDGESHMPYWATPWASGMALAEVILARGDEVRGRHLLELGCGLGTTAVAALQALEGRGTLTVADCVPETLAYCRYNALRNVGRAPRTLLADWRTDAGREALARAAPFDLVLAADVLYEPEDVGPLLDLAPRLVGAGGAFWLAEPGRTTSGRFVEAARGAGWVAQTDETERAWPAGAGQARVRVHRYDALPPTPTV